MKHKKLEIFELDEKDIEEAIKLMLIQTKHIGTSKMVVNIYRPSPNGGDVTATVEVEL